MKVEGQVLMFMGLLEQFLPRLESTRSHSMRQVNRGVNAGISMGTAGTVRAIVAAVL